MNCAGANLVPCRGSVQASDQYILLAWTQVPHRELPSCDKGDFRRQGQKSKRHHGRMKRILLKAAGTRPSTRLQKYCSQPPWVHHTHSSLPFSRRKLPKREQEPRDPPPVLSESESELSQHGVRFWKTLQDGILQMEERKWELGIKEAC